MACLIPPLFVGQSPNWYNQLRGDDMTLQEIIADIHALNEDLEVYERKYGVLSETFYELYLSGEEPEEETWVLDWADWAGAYKILLRRQEQNLRNDRIKIL
ncbi:MAG: hypothetical protein Fur0044_28510 [Anaerolineae bacterium]